jgi:hypothetical protein
MPLRRNMPKVCMFDNVFVIGKFSGSYIFELMATIPHRTKIVQSSRPKKKVIGSLILNGPQQTYRTEYKQSLQILNAVFIGLRQAAHV